MKIEEYVKKAEDLRSKGFFKESLKIWLKIYREGLRNNDPELTLDSLIALGDLNRIMGKFNKSLEFYNEASEIAEILGNERALADSLSGVALCYKAIGNWKEGLKLIRKARKIYEKNKDKKGIAFTLWAEGAIWRFGGRIKKSLDNFKKALAQFQNLKDKIALGYTYCGLGGSSRVNGNFLDSMKYYEKANKIFKEIKDRFGTAYSYCGIGNAFRMLNELKEAEENFEKALKIYREIGDIVSSSYTLWSLAITKLIDEYKKKKKTKDYKEAYDLILLAENNFKKCKDPRGLIYCKITKAMIYYLNDNITRGEKILKVAFENARDYDFTLEKNYAQGILSGKYRVPFNIP